MSLPAAESPAPLPEGDLCSPLPATVQPAALPTEADPCPAVQYKVPESHFRPSGNDFEIVIAGRSCSLSCLAARAMDRRIDPYDDSDF